MHQLWTRITFSMIHIFQNGFLQLVWNSLMKSLKIQFDQFINVSFGPKILWRPTGHCAMLVVIIVNPRFTGFLFNFVFDLPCFKMFPQVASFMSLNLMQIKIWLTVWFDILHCIVRYSFAPRIYCFKSIISNQRWQPIQSNQYVKPFSRPNSTRV